MRKIAPAFVLTTIVAFSSGSALALGDVNKNKKAATTSDQTAPADKTYTAPTNPSTNNAATASDTGKGGATASGSARGAPMSSTSPVTSSSAPVTTETVAVDKSAKAVRDCQGIAMTDPLYKANNCGAMKGGPGSSGEGSGGSAGAAGAAGSSSSGSGR